MGFFDRVLASASDAEFFLSHERSPLKRALGRRSLAGVVMDAEAARAIPAFHSGVSIYADAVAQLPIHVMEKTASGRRAEVKEHPARELLNLEANEETSTFVFKNTVEGHAVGWGNGYAEIEWDNRDEPVGLWQLLPDRTEPARTRDGKLAYETRIDGQPVGILARDVVHIPGFGFDGIRGYDPVLLFQESLGLTAAATEFGARWFGNGSQSGVAIKLPKLLSKPAEERMKEDWSSENAGLRNSHRVRVLYEGSEVVTTAIPPEAAQFLETREFQIAEVARMLRLPLHMLQSHEKSTSWGTGIEQFWLGFVRASLMPWILRWEQELNRKLFRGAARGRLYVKFNVDALLRGDVKTRADWYKVAVGKPFMKPSEARELEDLDPIEGIDDEPATQPPPGSPNFGQPDREEPEMPPEDGPEQEAA